MAKGPESFDQLTALREALSIGTRIPQDEIEEKTIGQLKEAAQSSSIQDILETYGVEASDDELTGEVLNKLVT